MGFQHDLLHATAPDQRRLHDHPFYQAALRGRLSRPAYLAFLEQSYYHTRQTAALLMAAGARLPIADAHLRRSLSEYTEEEIGHDDWILADLAACGHAADPRHGQPDFACELLIAFTYDQVTRRHPLAVLGLLLVLEGVSCRLHRRLADAITSSLDLAPTCVRFLRRQGQLDQAHYPYLLQLLDGIHEAAAQQAITHCARRCYGLYHSLLDGLPLHDRVADSSRVALSV